MKKRIAQQHRREATRGGWRLPTTHRQHSGDPTASTTTPRRTCDLCETIEDLTNTKVNITRDRTGKITHPHHSFSVKILLESNARKSRKHQNPKTLRSAAQSHNIVGSLGELTYSSSVNTHRINVMQCMTPCQTSETVRIYSNRMLCSCYSYRAPCRTRMYIRKFAYDLYLKLNEVGFQPNAVTSRSLLKGCASTKVLEWVQVDHRHISVGGYESEVCVGSTLLHMEGDGRSMHIQTADITNEAIAILGFQVEHGINANLYTHVDGLKRYSKEKTLERLGRLTTASLRVEWNRANIRVGTAAIQMYAKCGSIEEEVAGVSRPMTYTGR